MPNRGRKLPDRPQVARQLVGKRFGRLVVLFRAGRTYRSAAWFCKCDCGGERIVNGEQLVRKLNPTRACEDCKRIRLATTAKDAAGRFATQRKAATLHS
jgi:hypothetical protein